MTDDHSWTRYAPIDGPPDGTTCSFCATELTSGSRGWMIGIDNAAICPRCISLAAKALARDDLSEAGAESPD